MTLLELVVVIALLGILAAVASLAFASPAQDDGEQAEPARLIQAARARALATGVRVRVDLVVDGAPWQAIALPDGSVIADTALSIDRLTGRPTDALR